MKNVAVVTAATLCLASMTPLPALADPADGPPLIVSRSCTRAVTTGSADHVTGAVQVQMLATPEGDARTSAGSVTFAPGARTAWHTHPLGQTLIVTSGVGRVQRRGGPIEEIGPGDVVRIPSNVKHWHGAAPASSMTHLAIQESLDGRSVEWMEKVGEAQVPPAASAARAQPSRAQQSFGDVAPKLAELTDTVLFGDVWARPGLSPRDRNLP